MSAHFGFILTATRARPFWAGVAGALAGTALSLGGALAQESGSMQVGEATVTVGAGVALLTLPDVPSFVTLDSPLATSFSFIRGFEFSDSFGEEIGWNVSSSISVPVGAAKTVSLKGFWANIDDKDFSRCTDGGAANACQIFPLVDDPTSQTITSSAGVSFDSVTKRDVDIWGVSLEIKRLMNAAVMGATQAPSRRYLALGADVRGINQDLDVNVGASNDPFGFFSPTTYTEDLDTGYYGAYAAWGGGYSPFLFKGLWDRLGLRSSFRLSGGVYYADTDYSGRIVWGNNSADSTLKLSNNDVAFIGGLALETSKRIGRRTTLSLKSEYEYYSYVPKMAYNTVDLAPSPNNVPFMAGRQDGTNIGRDDAFSARAMLRLTIKLGPDSIMEPLK